MGNPAIVSRVHLFSFAVRASLMLPREFHPANFLDFESDRYFCSVSGPFEWIEFTVTWRPPNIASARQRQWLLEGCALPNNA
jgi:hypothetical protein